MGQRRHSPGFGANLQWMSQKRFDNCLSCNWGWLWTSSESFSPSCVLTCSFMFYQNYLDGFLHGRHHRHVHELLVNNTVFMYTPRTGPPNLPHVAGFRCTMSPASRCGSAWWMLHDARRPSLGAKTLLGAPGHTTRSKKLLGTKGIATRSKNATRLEAIAIRLPLKVRSI